MSQETSFQRAPKKIIVFTQAAKAVTASSTEMAEIDVRGVDRIFVHLTVGTAALTGFSIKAKANANTVAETLYSTSAHFTTPSGLLVGASADLTTLGVGTGWFIMDTVGLDKVSIFAVDSPGATATIAIEAGGA